MTLEIKNLTVGYGRGRNALTAVDGIDLSVPTGATLGLVGESGCGKSTVARAIVGLVPIVGGQLLLDGVDYTDAKMRRSLEFRRRVQMIFQDPFSSLNPRMTIEAMLREALSCGGKTKKDSVRNELVRLLDIVGIASGALRSYPHQLSGGQRQRIAIARALAVGPEIIVHDEVTSALDVSVQGSILNLLRELQREFGLSYLFISHDLSTVRYMSDAVSVMYLGQVVETAKTDALFASPRHPYTSALIESVPQLGQPRRPAPLAGGLPDPRHPPRGCRLNPRCPIGPVTQPERTICIEQDPRSVASLMEHSAACHFAVPVEELVDEALV
jgi:peptide/nickel transport system ATP-binding protein